MSLLWRHLEQRAVTPTAVWGSGGDPHRVEGPETLVALYAAMRLITDSVVTTPLQAVRQRPDGTTTPVTGPVPLLSPVGTTVQTWLTQCMHGLLSDGNAFGLVTATGATGWPTAVRWLAPHRVDVDDDAPLPEYAVDGRQVDRSELIHVPWLVPPGKWRGISPLRAFRATWETGVSAQDTARSWFAAGAIPSGHLRTDRRLDGEQLEAARRRFLSAVKGRGLFVSGSDWSYSAIGVPADDARWAEQLRMTATQVAAVYGLAPEDIGGESSGGLTYATVEGNERKLAARVIAPWTSRIEAALSAHMPGPQRLRFDLTARQRPELLTRMQALDIALRTGLMTLAEARESEGLPPLPDAPATDAPPTTEEPVP